VGLRGPGETQLEVDRREIHKRITHLKGELEKVRAHRHRYREQRRRSNVPTVALVGYTNAGKSTLLNKLARSDVYVANQLFATLDPTTRRVELPAGHTALFTDTVGFIQKLPTMLVAAFRATLEEINEADLLLHVLDVTHPNALEQWQSVQETLVDIGAQDIPMVTALNKIDRLASPETISASLSQRTPTIPISALTGQGAEDLLRLIEGQLFENYTQVTVHIPYRDGQLISLFHEQGKVESTKPVETYITIKGMLPTRMLFHFKNFMKPPVEPDQGSN
ncbi:MAG: GTPase HflX, partial [Bellilinea sp.]